MAKRHRIHIGHMIKKVFDESGISVTEFARRINCARPNVYSIFERYDIGMEQLIDISEALDHNFLDDVQLQSGLDSHLPTRHVDVHLNFESLSEENIERINSLNLALKTFIEKT